VPDDRTGDTEDRDGLRDLGRASLLGMDYMPPPPSRRLTPCHEAARVIVDALERVQTAAPEVRTGAAVRAVIDCFPDLTAADALGLVQCVRTGGPWLRPGGPDETRTSETE